MSCAICLEYQKNFKSVNLKLKNDDEKSYEYSILILYTLEIENGFKVKKIGKTTKIGTKVTYESFKSDEDVLKYKELLESKAKEFSEKWNIDLKIH